MNPERRITPDSLIPHNEHSPVDRITHAVDEVVENYELVQDWPQEAKELLRTSTLEQLRKIDEACEGRFSRVTTFKEKSLFVYVDAEEVQKINTPKELKPKVKLSTTSVNTVASNAILYGIGMLQTNSETFTEYRKKRSKRRRK